MAAVVEPSPRRLSSVLDEWSMPLWVAKTFVIGRSSMSARYPYGGGSKVIDHAKEVIRRKLRGKRGRRRQPGANPAVMKKKLAEEIIEGIHSQQLKTPQQTDQIQPLNGTPAKKWAFRKWRERWDRYLGTVSALQRTPAHGEKLGKERTRLHPGLRKAENSLAIQLCTGKQGFAAFLHARRVPV